MNKKITFGKIKLNAKAPSDSGAVPLTQGKTFYAFYRYFR